MGLFNRSKKVTIDDEDDFSSWEQGLYSCIDVVRIIRTRIADFNGNKGMVIIIKTGNRVQMYFFDGLLRCSWGYNNHEFTIDENGSECLAYTGEVGFNSKDIQLNQIQSLDQVLSDKFPDCEISVGSLWNLNPNAPDYEMMKIRASEDLGIRISFTQDAMRNAIKKSILAFDEEQLREGQKWRDGRK